MLWLATFPADYWAGCGAGFSVLPDDSFVQLLAYQVDAGSQIYLSHFGSDGTLSSTAQVGASDTSRTWLSAFKGDSSGGFLVSGNVYGPLDVFGTRFGDDLPVPDANYSGAFALHVFADGGTATGYLAGDGYAWPSGFAASGDRMLIGGNLIGTFELEGQVYTTPPVDHPYGTSDYTAYVDAFLVSFRDGQLEWANVWDAGAEHTEGYWFAQHILGLATDESGAAYLASGTSTNRVDVDAPDGTASSAWTWPGSSLSNQRWALIGGRSSAFLAATGGLTGSNGGILVAEVGRDGQPVWTQVLSPLGGFEDALLASTPSGDFVLASKGWNTVDLGLGPLVSPVDAGAFEGGPVVAELDSTGHPVWTRTFRRFGDYSAYQPASQEFGSIEAYFVDGFSNGDALLAGEAWGMVDLGTGVLDGGPAYGSGTCFVMRLSH